MEQKPLYKNKILIAGIIAIIWCAVCIASVTAIEINPSVDSQPWYCKYSLTKWVCNLAKPGATGNTGLQGEQGEQGPMGPAGIGGGQVLYFHHETSPDPAGYEGLSIIPAGSPEDDENVTITSSSGDVVIDPYITTAGYPGTTILPAGLWRFRTYHYVSSNVGTTRFIFTAYNRTEAGVMTKLFDIGSEDIDALSMTEYLTSYVQLEDYVVANTDRLVINVSANTTQPSPITAHFVYEGSEHTSHVQTPFPLAYTAPPIVNESYAYLPGRAGGQVLYGGSAANDDMTISGTSSGTKTTSYVLLQPSGGNVGINTITPSKPLEVAGSVGITGTYSSLDVPNLNVSAIGSSTAGGLRLTGASGTGRIYADSSGDLNMKTTNDWIFVDSRYGIDWRINGAPKMRISDAGYIGVGISSPSAQLHTTDTVRFQKYALGYAVFDTFGNVGNQSYLAGTKTYYVSDTSGGPTDRKLTFVNGILTSET